MSGGLRSKVMGVACGLLALSAGLLTAEPAAATDVAKQINCLALNIYFEARSEPEKGKVAVAHVVMNRVADPKFPDSICQVVKQGGERRRNRCQFSWWCDGRSDEPRDTQAWQESRIIAHMVFTGSSPDPTRGALFYHADYVDPYWKTAFMRGPKIGRHIFYRVKGQQHASANH
jgi:spore germination cell wall hydrolase CwlJ-like protein